MMESHDDPALTNSNSIPFFSDNDAANALEIVGKLLNQADSFLEELDSNEMLGEAILRTCDEFANVLDEFAQDLEKTEKSEKENFAHALLEEMQQSQTIMQEEIGAGNSCIQKIPERGNLDHGQIMEALEVGIPELLRDVEAAFRSISNSEAEEIADVAVTVARLFVMSLKNFHGTMIGNEDFSNRIEILEEEGTHLEERSRSIELENNISTNGPKVNNKLKGDRMRPLWPPLGPAAVDATKWGQHEAAKKPLLAVALGLTLWPVAIITTLMSPPILLADHIVQNVYNSLHDTPLLVAAERTTAQVFHAGKLSLLCSGLILRQTARVASRQVERRGGWVSLSQTLSGMALDRVMHPMETLSVACDGLFMGVQWVQDGVSFVQEIWEREQEKAIAEKMNE
mmetsp:Transcript_16726/g.25459  ORF Transcript_16726/g.25459 Transcript_16726/m.25459 type:complete len:399 (-) Transcript_16726:135-1331(-)|eukprot:CAMPEP_0194252532 /NCGR_PEP_ID=MMETSP0158-20130606/27826_1 /TAXON_ID=33649 /ORGANISM="Thalassionema nitzschioides, Strain L26-B" /LENGTH=398 /DNA_ID=CAMNT_0038989969 /DNA_START=44 /DNA_END=1240 /DNA_ORIENTATION=+